jgi:hypothetical protein
MGFVFIISSFVILYRDDYLMRPYLGFQSKGDNESSIFNYRFSRARKVVENAFALLNHTFKIYQKTLQSLPEDADNIILRPVFCIII